MATVVESVDGKMMYKLDGQKHSLALKEWEYKEVEKKTGRKVVQGNAQIVNMHRFCFFKPNNPACERLSYKKNLKIGDNVIIRGLIKRPGFNGTTGEVIKGYFRDKNGNLRVRIYSDATNKEAGHNVNPIYVFKQKKRKKTKMGWEMRARLNKDTEKREKDYQRATRKIQIMSKAWQAEKKIGGSDDYGIAQEPVFLQQVLPYVEGIDRKIDMKIGKSDQNSKALVIGHGLRHFSFDEVEELDMIETIYDPTIEELERAYNKAKTDANYSLVNPTKSLMSFKNKFISKLIFDGVERLLSSLPMKFWDKFLVDVGNTKKFEKKNLPQINPPVNSRKWHDVFKYSQQQKDLETADESIAYAKVSDFFTYFKFANDEIKEKYKGKFYQFYIFAQLIMRRTRYMKKQRGLMTEKTINVPFLTAANSKDTKKVKMTRVIPFTEKYMDSRSMTKSYMNKDNLLVKKEQAPKKTKTLAGAIEQGLINSAGDNKTKAFHQAYNKHNLNTIEGHDTVLAMLEKYKNKQIFDKKIIDFTSGILKSSKKKIKAADENDEKRESNSIKIADLLDNLENAKSKEEKKTYKSKIRKLEIENKSKLKLAKSNRAESTRFLREIPQKIRESIALSAIATMNKGNENQSQRREKLAKAVKKNSKAIRNMIGLHAGAPESVVVEFVENIMEDESNVSSGNVLDKLKRRSLDISVNIVENNVKNYFEKNYLNSIEKSGEKNKMKEEYSPKIAIITKNFVANYDGRLQDIPERVEDVMKSVKDYLIDDELLRISVGAHTRAQDLGMTIDDRAKIMKTARVQELAAQENEKKEREKELEDMKKNLKHLEKEKAEFTKNENSKKYKELLRKYRELKEEIKLEQDSGEEEGGEEEGGDKEYDDEMNEKGQDYLKKLKEMRSFAKFVGGEEEITLVDNESPLTRTQQKQQKMRKELGDPKKGAELFVSYIDEDNANKRVIVSGKLLEDDIIQLDRTGERLDFNPDSDSWEYKVIRSGEGSLYKEDDERKKRKWETLNTRKEKKVNKSVKEFIKDSPISSSSSKKSSTSPISSSSSKNSSTSPMSNSGSSRD